MKAYFYFSWQIGLMISFGTNYERRFYVCLEFPFFYIQLLWLIPEKRGEKRKEKEIEAQGLFNAQT